MTAPTLRRVASHRCFHHAGREAVARCVACGRAYCRECVAEHDGRMICATCLRREAAAPAVRQSDVLAATGRALFTLLAFFVAWCCFFGVAQLLLKIPAPVHEESVWSAE